MDRAELEAARKITALLLEFASNARGAVLRRAIDDLDPSRHQQQYGRTYGLHCTWCKKPFTRKSYNQRYCSYQCGRDAGAQKRLETSALQFDLTYGERK